MSSDVNRRFPWSPLLLAALLSLGYLLSYAPVYRIGKAYGWSNLDRQPVVYQPINWMIDQTPLDEPLYLWADCWGVRGDFVWAAAARSFRRGESTLIVAPDPETPHLYEHVTDEESP